MKHRSNKNQKQRIIIFVASPLKEETQNLIKLGKRLKKNNISVDVVSFGDENNSELLNVFVENVNNGDSR